MTSMTGITNAGAQDRRTASPAETLERTLNQAIGAVRSNADLRAPSREGLDDGSAVRGGDGWGGARGGGGSSARASAEQTGDGEGFGGGGGGRGRPVAVIVIRQDGVTVQPVLDVTRHRARRDHHGRLHGVLGRAVGRRGGGGAKQGLGDPSAPWRVTARLGRRPPLIAARHPARALACGPARRRAHDRGWRPPPRR